MTEGGGRALIAFDNVPDTPDTEADTLTAEEIALRKDAEARRKWERDECGVDVSGGGPP